MSWKDFFYILCGTVALLLRFFAMTLGAWFIADAVGFKINGEGLGLIYAAFVLFYFAGFFKPWFMEDENKECKTELEKIRRRLEEMEKKKFGE